MKYHCHHICGAHQVKAVPTAGENKAHGVDFGLHREPLSLLMLFVLRKPQVGGSHLSFLYLGHARMGSLAGAVHSLEHNASVLKASLSVDRNHA